MNQKSPLFHISLTMKHLFLSILSILFLSFISVAAVIGWGIHHYYHHPHNIAASTTVFIERGTGASQIADLLEKEDIISHAMLFQIAARLSPPLKAGEYAFPTQASMHQIMTLLVDGAVIERKITLIEGLTSYQIVKRLNEKDDFAGEKVKEIPAEGSLLPNTYHYTSMETRMDMIERMQQAMTKTIDELWPTRAENIPFQTKDEALILASIVEKESSIVHEQAKVAGVFINRLNIGMPLQTDPTVIYALTKGKIQEGGKGPIGRRLLRKDLKVPSPYNTYLNRGLPPGPIANPGANAIKAVLQPKSHDYLYFVADGTGGHAFAKTLAGHNKNAAQWRKIRSAQ